MLRVDIRHEHLVKVWRVSGQQIEVTAAILRHEDGYAARVHYALPDGSVRRWAWREKHRSVLTEREAVLCMTNLDRGFKSLPGTYTRIDFPTDSTDAEQVLILMDYGLHGLLNSEGPADMLDLGEGSLS